MSLVSVPSIWQILSPDIRRHSGPSLIYDISNEQHVYPVNQSYDPPAKTISTPRLPLIKIHHCRQQMIPSKFHHQNVLKFSAHVPRTGLDWLKLKNQNKISILLPPPRTYSYKGCLQFTVKKRHCRLTVWLLRSDHYSGRHQGPDQTNNTASESRPQKCQHVRAMHPEGTGQCVCTDKASEEK